MIVATGAHAFTGVQLRHLDDLLEGNPTITFQFNYGDVAIGEWTGPLDRPTPWTMPPELSAIVWIDNRFPFTAAARVNPHARRPVHPALTRDVPNCRVGRFTRREMTSPLHLAGRAWRGE